MSSPREISLHHPSTPCYLRLHSGRSHPTVTPSRTSLTPDEPANSNSLLTFSVEHCCSHRRRNLHFCRDPRLPEPRNGFICQFTGIKLAIPRSGIRAGIFQTESEGKCLFSACPHSRIKRVLIRSHFGLWQKSCILVNTM